jgi:type I restriction enzyme, S subunit
MTTLSTTPLTPRLRFPGFSGEWKKTSLGSLFDYRNGEAYENRIVEIGKFDLITLNSIDITGKLKRLHKQVDFADWYLKANDMVMVLSDVAHGYFLGVTDVISVDDKYVLNQRMGLLRSKSSISVHYANMYINNSQKYFKLHGQGSSQKNLSKSDILNFKIGHPSAEEQAKIADFLTTVDTHLTLQKSKIHQLKQYKKSLLQKLFPRSGAVLPEVRFRDEKGNEFPGWENEKLLSLGEIIGGGTPDTSKPELWGGAISWLTPTEVKSKYVDSTKRTITPEGLTQSSARLLPVGTVVFTSRATVGDVAISRLPLVTNQGFQSIVVNDSHDNRFIYFWILKNKKIFLRKSSGSTFPEISKVEMGKVIVGLSTKAEQNKIADFLTSVDEKITNQERRLASMEEFKKGVLGGLFV